MKWSEDQVAYLVETYPSDKSLSFIAHSLGKSVIAIKHKAARLNLSRKSIPHNKPLVPFYRKQYDAAYYSKNKNRIYFNKRRRELGYKIELVKLLGGKCSSCGYNRCPAALDFHHKNDKEGNITYLISRVSKEKLLKEAQKCILLCSNCHREFHFKGA